MVLGVPLEHEWLVPKLQLGNPIAGKAPALREHHLVIAPYAPSRSLGTRKRRDALRFPALRLTGLRARQAVRTGWKACATERTFQGSSSWAYRPTRKT